MEQGRLRSPPSHPELASLTISPEYLDRTLFRNPPIVEISVQDGVPRYHGEADNVDLDPHLLPAPLSNGCYVPESNAGDSESGKRYHQAYAGSTGDSVSSPVSSSACLFLFLTSAVVAVLTAVFIGALIGVLISVLQLPF